MKSQSLEVLSEIRKTLSVLSIQIEKLSAALGELEDAGDDAVSEAKDAEAGFSFECEAVPETEDSSESESGSVFDFEEVDAAVEDEFNSASSAGLTLEADDALIDNLSPEEMPVSDVPARVDLAASPVGEISAPTESSPVLPSEEMPVSDLHSAEAGPELEAVDLSQDIEVEADEMRLPDVHDFQWMIDIPGSKVANVISAISLNDRVLLINTLFKENPELFQRTISKFNNMENFSEAISYVLVTFPEWNLNSDVVYRLMMAVRRRLG